MRPWHFFFFKGKNQRGQNTDMWCEPGDLCSGLQKPSALPGGWTGSLLTEECSARNVKFRVPCSSWSSKSRVARLCSFLQWHLLWLEEAQVAVFMQTNLMFLPVTELVYRARRSHRHKSLKALARIKWKVTAVKVAWNFWVGVRREEKENPCKGSRQGWCVAFQKTSQEIMDPQRGVVCCFGAGQASRQLESEWLLNRSAATMTELASCISQNCQALMNGNAWGTWWPGKLNFLLNWENPCSFKSYCW